MKTRSTTEQIQKLAGILRLSQEQTARVLGFDLLLATESEKQAGKERLIAFVNRVQNDRLTQEDAEILALSKEESACPS